MTESFPESIQRAALRGCDTIKTVGDALVGVDADGVIKVLERQARDIPFRVSALDGDKVYHSTEFSLVGDAPKMRSTTDYDYGKTGAAPLTTQWDEKGEVIRHTGLTVDFNPQETDYISAQINAVNRGVLAAQGTIPAKKFMDTSRIIPPSKMREQFGTALAAAKEYVDGLPLEERGQFSAGQAL